MYRASSEHNECYSPNQGIVQTGGMTRMTSPTVLYQGECIVCCVSPNKNVHLSKKVLTL